MMAMTFSMLTFDDSINRIILESKVKESSIGADSQFTDSIIYF